MNLIILTVFLIGLDGSYFYMKWKNKQNYYYDIRIYSSSLKFRLFERINDTKLYSVFSTTQKLTAYIYYYFPYQVKHEGFIKAAFIYSKTIINNSKKEHIELCFKVVLNEIKLWWFFLRWVLVSE